jgi:hypothetical protein
MLRKFYPRQANNAAHPPPQRNTSRRAIVKNAGLQSAR